MQPKNAFLECNHDDRSTLLLKDNIIASYETDFGNCTVIGGWLICPSCNKKVDAIGMPEDNLVIEYCINQFNQGVPPPYTFTQGYVEWMPGAA